MSDTIITHETLNIENLFFEDPKQYNMKLLLLNACVRVADVMIFTFVSLMPVHNVCRICMIIKQ